MTTTLFPSIVPDTEPDEEGTDSDVELCGAEKSDGSLCDRPADSCQYH